MATSKQNIKNYLRFKYDIYHDSVFVNKVHQSQ